ncbi:MAG: O-antigen ligase family protein [Patescibacteria group bacterium]
MNYPHLPLTYPKVFHNLKTTFARYKEELSINPQNLLLRLSLYLLFLTFPANLAKAFILPQSYVLGILVDYLIPKLYFTELLVLGIFLLTSWKKPKDKLFVFLLVIFFLSLLPSFFISSFPLISGVRFAQLFLWFGFSFWISQNLLGSLKKKLFSLLGWGVTGVVVLALFQLYLQHSLFGYWFFGEPTLTPSLGGVAMGSFLGREILLPYGTFPHPNVMGGILSVLALWFAAKKRWGFFSFAVLGTLVSFSQTAWLSLFLGLLGVFFTKRFLALLSFNPAGFWQISSVQRRLDLLTSSWEMFKSAPFWGVGLGSFTKALPLFGVPAGLLLFLQPVHNIFALVASESGILALGAFLFLWFFAFKKGIEKKDHLLTISLGQLLLLGFFDHYLYTLPQGLFLLSLVWGLSFSKGRLLDRKA